MPSRPAAVRQADAEPAPFIDDYLAYLLARASHLISTEFHAVVRRSRLPVLQWRVLATLADGQAPSIGEVAEIVLVPQSTLTRVAERMVRSGLLLRTHDDADRRITRIRLSPQGRALARKLVAQAREHENLVLSTVDDADAKALKDMLRKLIRKQSGPGGR